MVGSWFLLLQVVSILTIFQFANSVIIPKHEVLRAADSGAVLKMDTQSFTNLTSCGGSLTTKTGAIYYKPNQPILPNERCAWIIRPDHSELQFVTGFTVGVFSMGFENVVGEHQIIISSFSAQGWTQTSLNDTRLYDISGNIILITLAAGQNFSSPDKRGIHIQYSANRNGNATQSSRSSLVAFSNDISSYIRHQYTDNEVSAFLYHPNSNVINELVTLTVKLTIVKLEECYDHLYILKFNGSQWISGEKICDQREPVYASSSDLILVLFLSDSSNVEAGFELRSAQCASVDSVDPSM